MNYIKDTDISSIINKNESDKLITKRGLELILQIGLVAGLIFFIITFYLQMYNIYLTYYIAIVSIALLISKLLYWIMSKDDNLKKNDDSFYSKLIICVFVYVAPIYTIIQEPYLIVNRNISLLTFIIVTVLAIVGILIDRNILKKF